MPLEQFNSDEGPLRAGSDQRADQTAVEGVIEGSKERVMSQSICGEQAQAASKKQHRQGHIIMKC